MGLKEAINDVIKSVPDCLAAGFIDMQTGMLLGYKTVDSHPQEVIELLAAATGDLFQGSNVQTIEKMFKKIRGIPDTDNEHYINEMIVISKNLIHVFLRSKKYPQQVLVTVARGGANLGMVLSKSRMAVGPVEESA